MISARDLAKKKFRGLQLNAPYDELIGVPEISMSCLISGFPGEGKSTLALQLAKELSRYGNVLYVAAEEGTGFTMQEKIKRLGLANSDVKFTDWEGFSTLKKQIGKNHIDFVVLDSITAMDRYLRDFDDFRQWMKNNDRGLIVVSHSTKAGGYKGDSSLGHDVDTIVELQGGTARTTKNRYGQLAEIPVNFGKPTPSARNNPQTEDIKELVRKTLSDKQYNGFIDIGSVDKKQAEFIRSLIKEDVSGYTYVVDSSAIRHSFTQHGNISKEEKKGQIAITVSDFDRLSEILGNPDLIRDGGKTKDGLQTLVYEKRINGNIIYVQEIRKGRKKLALKTMWKHHVPALHTASKKGLAHTSETDQDHHTSTKSKDTKNNRKNPVRSFSDPLVYLGKTLKVTIDSEDGVRTLKGTGKEDRFPMFASLNKHRLYIVPPEFVKRVSDKVHSRQADSVYEEWNGYDTDNVDYAIEWPKKGTKAVDVGWADHIWYESDKVIKHGDGKGKPHYYVHKFDKHKRPAAVMGNVLVISNLDIDERGILN